MPYDERFTSDERSRESSDDQSLQYSGDERPKGLYGSYQRNQRTQQQRDGSDAPSQTGQNTPALTADDIRLLKQCNRESFYYRCLPLSVAGCTVVYALGQRSTVKPRIWQYIASAFAGWFIGKLSYRKICSDKLVNSQSNSPFVNAIRKRRGILTDDYQSPVTSEFSSEMQSDWEMTKEYSKSAFVDEGFDVTQESREDSQESPQFSTTYDDLRSKNRSGFKF